MLTRREFLQFVVGGALGAVFSPLPWRIADEMVLFTQRWTYQAPDGEESWTKALCQLCPGGCGLTVRKIDNRVVSVKGDSLNPVKEGGLCPLGASSVQLLYGEKRRVVKPLKQEGGRWKEIEWNEALDILAQKLREFREKRESYTLACVDGYGHGLMSNLIKRFCKSYGTPNYLKMPSADDASSLAIELMQGHKGQIGFDLENSDYILSFGSQLLEGWGIPVRMQRVYANSLKTKTKIVQIEPRLSDTAAKAHELLPLKPGTEAALALGFAHVIIKEGLYNQDFISNSTHSFDAFKELVLKEYSPKAVANITGVNVNDIKRIAKEFAQAKRPLAIWGKGKGNIPCGLYEVMAIHALNALVGNINKKGGVVCFNEIAETWWPELNLDTTATESLKMERIDQARTKKYPLATSMLQQFAFNLTTEPKYPVNTLLIFEANPCYAGPQPDLFMKAVKKVPFVVVFTTFWTETAQQADLVLPTPFYLETWNGITTPKSWPYPVFGISKPVTQNLYDTKHPGDVILTISKKISNNTAQALPWGSFEEILKTVAKKIYSTGEGKLASKQVSGLPSDFNTMWEKLSQGIWFNPDVKKAGFQTNSAKFEFLPSKFSGLNLSQKASLPHYEAWKLKGSSEEFPLTLISYETLMLTEGYIASSPYMMKALPATLLKGNDLLVEIHPGTAAKYKLAEGDKVRIKTPFGEAKVRVHIFEGIMPELIAVPLGLGHSAYDEYLAGKGVNAHQLLGYTEEKISGIATWAMAKVNLVKI